MGEAHNPETHLIPRAIAAACGAQDVLAVFGTDYDTPDGTAVGDYLHVTDIASAHVKAVERTDSAECLSRIAPDAPEIRQCCWPILTGCARVGLGSTPFNIGQRS